jgi:AcrR family transcriptional regulator
MDHSPAGEASPTAAAPRRAQAERRAVTRERVLDAATALVAAHGSAGASLAAVGAAAGYSRGIVTHHFGGKDALIAAVLAHAQDFATPDEAGTGLGRVDALVRTYLRAVRVETRKPEAFLRLWAESMGSGSPLRSLLAERDAWFLALVATHVRDGIRDGSVRADANADTVAPTIVGMLRGTAMLLLSTSADADADEIADGAADLVTRGLAAA